MKQQTCIDSLSISSQLGSPHCDGRVFHTVWSATSKLAFATCKHVLHIFARYRLRNGRDVHQSAHSRRSRVVEKPVQRRFMAGFRLRLLRLEGVFIDQLDRARNVSCACFDEFCEDLPGVTADHLAGEVGESLA